MEILLVKDIENLGKRGELVSVARGYFRNFLGPKGLALIASDGNRRVLAEREKTFVKRDSQHRAVAEELAAKIDGLSFSVTMQANDEGGLYGSVTEQTIVKLLADKKLVIEARHVNMESHIKELGDHEVDIVLHGTVKAAIKLKIVSE